VRRPGGGRKPLTEVDGSLLKDLERLVDADSRGDPESLLRWTSKSVRHLAGGLRELGHQVHFTTVAQLLRGLGYSLQANVKTREGRQHPDRDAQFGHINAVAKRAVDRHEPVISVDTKKKELVGDFKNVGREWRPKGEPELGACAFFCVSVGGLVGDAVSEVDAEDCLGLCPVEAFAP
jgi:hypothetical protein